MIFIRRRRAALLLAAAAPPFASAQAATCSGEAGSAVSIGSVVEVPAGAARTFAITLGSGEGVHIDLTTVKSEAASEDSEEGDSSDAPRALRLCDAKGAVVAPRAGEVFEKGGSSSKIEEGERLRFAPRIAGRYTISVAASDVARELLVRHRDVGTAGSPIVSASLDGEQKGIASSKAPMVFSFEGTAGQWVELKSTSEKDTLLRLAAPDREGNYSVIVENDDSDGLNPLIRRKLPIAGTYYVQVDSLSDEAGEFDLSLKRIEAPKPPPPPVALRSGAPVSGKLADADDVRMFTLAVLAGHSYRLELKTEYDGVVAIGVANPLEPEDGATGADAGFTEAKSQDANTSGTEKLSFSARSNGQVLVRVKSFGIGDTDGSFALTAVDLGL